MMSVIQLTCQGSFLFEHGAYRCSLGKAVKHGALVMGFSDTFAGRRGARLRALIERICEPTPGEELKLRDPKGYDRLCRLPAFIFVRARKDGT
jgi:hypothetical protein